MTGIELYKVTLGRELTPDEEHAIRAMDEDCDDVCVLTPQGRADVARSRN